MPKTDFPIDEVLLTVEELATRLGLKRSWVYSHAGDLGAYRLGKYLRFDWQRVIERLERFGTLGRSLGRTPNDPA